MAQTEIEREDNNKNERRHLYNEGWWENELWSLYPNDLREEEVVTKVFVAEDDAFTARLFSRIVGQVNSRAMVEKVSSVEEAHDLLTDTKNMSRDYPYDLFIIDVFLDGSGTGLEIMKLCQALYPEVPVVVTSVAPEKKVQQMFGRQFTDTTFLQKPFSPDECKGLIQQLIQSDRSH